MALPGSVTADAANRPPGHQLLLGEVGVAGVCSVGSVELMGVTVTPQRLAKGNNPVQTPPGCRRIVPCPHSMRAR